MYTPPLSLPSSSPPPPTQPKILQPSASYPPPCRTSMSSPSPPTSNSPSPPTSPMHSTSISACIVRMASLRWKSVSKKTKDFYCEEFKEAVDALIQEG
ncbi:conserved hypothetical protein [Ricinus communis]|uniref:Uncharacterized protein n=1 Tax=Ricinus communis TaxID=3988 RepID=B9REK8_RICCO|nr:conserved hypothetical protein [Ricinus communis]